MASQSLLALIIVLSVQAIASSGKSDSEILLDFKSSLGNNSALSDWKTSTSPCSGNKTQWVGVLCEQGKVWGLKLENMGLNGAVDLEPLKELKEA